MVSAKPNQDQIEHKGAQGALLLAVGMEKTGLLSKLVFFPIKAACEFVSRGSIHIHIRVIPKHS